MDPFTREFCKTLSGFRIHDWNQFQNSLVNAFYRIVPQHRIMQQKLHYLIEDTSRIRMACEAEVHQYYRDFLCFVSPLFTKAT